MDYIPVIKDSVETWKEGIRSFTSTKRLIVFSHGSEISRKGVGTLSTRPKRV